MSPAHTALLKIASDRHGFPASDGRGLDASAAWRKWRSLGECCLQTAMEDSELYRETSVSGDTNDTLAVHQPSGCFVRIQNNRLSAGRLYTLTAVPHTSLPETSGTLFW